MSAPLGSDRRTLLKSAGMVVLAGGTAATLGACSDETPTAGGSAAPESSAPGSSTPEPSAPASSAPPSADPSSSASAPSGPTVAKADVPEGGGMIMGDADYVVTQPTAGDYKAFSKICTHQGCPVGEITNKEIVCPCHGSHFSITDGAPIAGPAQKPLPAATVTVSGDDLVIST